MGKWSYEEIVKDESFHKWHQYAPQEVQYMRYAKEEPSIIAAGHKIADVYSVFANARALLIYAHADDLGDIASDELGRNYAKTLFLTNALLEYAICLDFSWQVIWAYIQPTSLAYLMNQDYKKMEKECNRESVIAQLDCIISQNATGVMISQDIKSLLNDFDNDEDTLELRSIYNGLKHQGMIHFEGLGENYTRLAIGINGSQPPMLHRKSYTVDYIEELLIRYHFKFEIYIEKLIDKIMPDDYKNNKIEFIESINAIIELQKNCDNN